MLRVSMLSLAGLCLLCMSPRFHGQTPEAVESAPATTAVASSTDQTPVPAEAEHERASSQVRIVRLSQVQGNVEVDRNTGRGLERAFANIPITKGSKLTTETGLAEVEFEDNSSLRLTPDTVVEFAELGRAANGATLTRCRVVKGMVYVNMAKTPGTAFSLTAGTATIRLLPASHIRLEVDAPTSTLAVLEGAVDFGNGAGAMTVAKKRTLSFTTASADAAPTVANEVGKTAFDAWDKQGSQYQQHYSSLAAVGSGFGASDLNYYGGFVDMPGCGSLWRPYFTSAAWDPYGAGMWAWYGNAGYSWVSPYPWGWLPYHSGSWQFCPGSGGGWGWQPGAAFRGLYNVPRMTGAGMKPGPRPPLPPGPGHPHLLAVGLAGAASSHMTSPEKFTFQQNSAGLGVPRETFGKLGKTSIAVERHGVANAAVSTGYIGLQGSHEGSPVAANSLAGRSAGAGVRPVAVLSRPSGGGAVSVPSASLTGVSSRTSTYAGQPSAMHSSASNSAPSAPSASPSGHVGGGSSGGSARGASTAGGGSHH